MLSNLIITIDWFVVRALALLYRAKALTTNLELFTPTYLSLDYLIFAEPTASEIELNPFSSNFCSKPWRIRRTIQGPS